PKCSGAKCQVLSAKTEILILTPSNSNPPTFQELLLRLQTFFAERGCVLQQPYDVEVGAGTMAPETFLRVLGPDPYKVAYVQPSRRPAGHARRFGDHPVHLLPAVRRRGPGSNFSRIDLRAGTHRSVPAGCGLDLRYRMGTRSGNRSGDDLWRRAPGRRAPVFGVQLR